MKRIVASLFVIVGLAGCQSTPQPSFDVLAPFGSSRVPPPGTTNYAAKGAYYNPNAPASTGPAGAAPTTGLPATPNTATPGVIPQRPQAALPQNQSQTLASTDPWRTPASSTAPTAGALVPGTAAAPANSVIPAAYNANLTAAMVTQTPVGTGVLPTVSPIPSSPMASQTGPKLNGLALTDATKASAIAEPAKFQPAPGATEISQLPSSAAAATSVPNAVSKEVVSTAQASDQAKPAAAATVSPSTLNWRTRPVATGTGG